MPKFLIPEFNLFYAEGEKWHVYLQVYQLGDRFDIGICPARDDEEALARGAANGSVVYSNRLIHLLGRLSLYLKIEKDSKIG